MLHIPIPVSQRYEKNGNKHFIIDYISHSVVKKTTDITDTSDHTHHTNPPSAVSNVR